MLRPLALGARPADDIIRHAVGHNASSRPWPGGRRSRRCWAGSTIGGSGLIVTAVRGRQLAVSLTQPVVVLLLMTRHTQAVPIPP
jgi:hypothetical protein